MSTFLDVDLTQTPDKFPQLGAGIYTVVIKEAELKPNKKNTGTNLVVKMEVRDSQDEKANGLTVMDFLATKGEHAIGLKHLVQSCGLPLTTNGFDISSLIGKTAKIRVTTRVYTADDGQAKETPSIQEYMH